MAALVEACIKGDLAQVEKLINKGHSINDSQLRGRRPLLEASYRGHSDIVRYLLEQNADVNKTDYLGLSALHCACWEGHLDVVNMLLSKRAKIEAKDVNGRTPLIVAVLHRHPTVVEALISSGASVNVKTSRGDTVLDHALETGHLNIIDMLISKGVIIMSKDGQDMTPLIGAIVRGHHTEVVALILSGANVNRRNNRGYTALHCACQYGHLHIVKTLISNGANIEAEDCFGRTPLMKASEHGHHLVVEVLISSGASIYHKDWENCTALWYAAHESQKQCCLLLIAAGADVRPIPMHLQARLMHNPTKEGLDSEVKSVILAGFPVNLKDNFDRSALHHAAKQNRIQCGILLIESGADIRIKDWYGCTPLDYASAEFKAAVEEALSFRSKKTICVIGNACSGKSTLIASLQNENASLFKKVYNRMFGVKDIRQRTAGIEPVTLSSKRYGNVVMFDFAGQHEYHGPHEMLLESMLTRSGSTVTAILVVNVTEESSVIFKQLYRWLTPISKMSSSSKPVRVIVVGSFLDKVKSKAQAREKLIHCYQRIQEDLKDAAMEFQGTCFLNCRQPYSGGIDQLCQWLSEIPTPQYKATDTPYSISWVVSRINHAFHQQAVKLVDLSQWMDENEADLPTNLPSAEVVCSDLSATGHFLFLPNKEDSSKSWLILDLPTILHNVYGRLFSPFEKIVDQFGLLKCQDLQRLFSTLDEDMIRNVLIALEFCIEVDPTLLSEEIMKLKGSKDDFLFFPALVSAQPPEAFPGPPTDSVLPTLCWQLQADDKQFISPRLLQTVILRLAAHHVFHHQLGRNIKEHTCSVWWNGISWQSPNGVDVAVQISDNALVQVLGRSKAGPDILCQYTSEITFDIVTTIRQLLPDFSAISYIIRTSDPISLLKEPKNLSSDAMFLISSVLSIMRDGKDFCFSRPDQRGQSASLSVSELFSGVCPSLDTVQKLCFDPLIHDVHADQTGTLLTQTTVGTTVLETGHDRDRALTTQIMTEQEPTTITEDLSPSESDLSKVLDIVPEWYNLAVALGVPVERVKQFQQIKTGGLEALCYWRCSETGQNYPTSWRFLLAKIEEHQGHNVAGDVKKVFFPNSLMTDPKESSSSSDPVTSTSETHPFDVSEQLHESSPDSQCGSIIEKYKDRFLACIDAHAIARKLEIEEVISNRVSFKIENSAPEDANDLLFLHLRSHLSLETIHKLCDVMISMRGYPQMNKLGRLMTDDLTTVTASIQ